MGLSTDPAAAIHFEEETEGKGDSSAAGVVPAKKKISLVDYFYVKVTPLHFSPDDSTTAVFNNPDCLASLCERIHSYLWK